MPSACQRDPRQPFHGQAELTSEGRYASSALSVFVACPYLGREVELTDERAEHIRKTHPEMAADLEIRVRSALTQPEEVRRSRREPDARLFLGEATAAT